MAIKEDIRSWLVAWPGLSAIGERVYHRRLKKGSTFPALTYFRVSPGKVYSHDGFSGLQKPRYQFTVWSRDADEAETLGDAVIEAMHEFPYNDGQGVFLEGDHDPEDPEAELFMRVLDFFIWHN